MENQILEKLLDSFLTIFLPLLLILCVERLTLHKLAQTENGKKWVRSQFWLHPNFISYCRYPMGFVSVFLFHTGFTHIAAIWFGFWMITDLTDGTIARDFGLETATGKVIDPMSDKLLYFPPLFYFSYVGIFPMYLAFGILLFDMTGQFSRYFIVNKAANLFGKAKTFLIFITLGVSVTEWIYFPGTRWSIAIVICFGAMFLAFCSMFFKVIPNYWYANILSLMNFFCGLGGITLIYFGYHPAIAFSLVFLGQFLDLFDGRAAERWGSTPRGELLDDLADGTNFGGTIGFIVAAAFNFSLVGIALGMFHFSCTTFRLVRFLANKKDAGIQGGVKRFMGLPSPAAALVVGSIATLSHNEALTIVCTILASVLMVSKIPYIHFGRVVLPNVPKALMVLTLTVFFVALLVAISTKKFEIMLMIVFAASIAYLVFGYPWKCYKMNTEN